MKWKDKGKCVHICLGEQSYSTFHF